MAAALEDVSLTARVKPSQQAFAFLLAELCYLDDSSDPLLM